MSCTVCIFSDEFVVKWLTVVSHSLVKNCKIRTQHSFLPRSLRSAIPMIYVAPLKILRSSENAEREIFNYHLLWKQSVTQMMCHACFNIVHICLLVDVSSGFRHTVCFKWVAFMKWSWCVGRNSNRFSSLRKIRKCASARLCVMYARQSLRPQWQI